MCGLRWDCDGPLGGSRAQGLHLVFGPVWRVRRDSSGRLPGVPGRACRSGLLVVGGSWGVLIFGWPVDAVAGIHEYRNIRWMETSRLMRRVDRPLA